MPAQADAGSAWIAEGAGAASTARELVCLAATTRGGAGGGGGAAAQPASTVNPAVVTSTALKFIPWNINSPYATGVGADATRRVKVDIHDGSKLTSWN